MVFEGNFHYNVKEDTLTRTAIFECKRLKKIIPLASWYSREMNALEPLDTYTRTEKVTIVSPMIRESLIENKAKERAKELGCKFEGFKESQDWLPRFMCEDVYGLQGGSAEKCRKLFYSKLSNIKSVDEGKGLLSKADGFLSSVFRAYDNAVMTHIRITGKGIWSMPK